VPVSHLEPALDLLAEAVLRQAFAAQEAKRR